MGTHGLHVRPSRPAATHVDVRSDIFSFGALLYEMATGQRAFAGKTPAETLSAVMQSQPTLPSTLIPSLPHDLERTILRCLRKEPAKRFQTMADVRVDLAEIKEESDSSRTTPATTIRPEPRRVLAATVLLLLVAAVAAVWWWNTHALLKSASAPDAPNRAPPVAPDVPARPSDRRDVFTGRPVDRVRIGPGGQLRYLGAARSGQGGPGAGDEIAGGGHRARLVA